MISNLLLAAAFIGGTVALVLLSYAVVRRLAAPGDLAEAREFANGVVIRIATLHSLILSLVFAQEMLSYHDLRDELGSEANAVADLYNDLRRYGSDEGEELRGEVLAYARVVIEREWHSGQGFDGSTASAEGWALWDGIYEAVLDLPAETPREDALRARMLAGIDVIAEMRDRRSTDAMGPVEQMFWIAAIGGVVLIAMSWFTFRPSRRTFVLMGIFGTYTGLILFFIHAFSDPLSPPGALPPLAMEGFLDDVTADEGAAGG
jgi:hypothetical protein